MVDVVRSARRDALASHGDSPHDAAGGRDTPRIPVWQAFCRTVSQPRAFPALHRVQPLSAGGIQKCRHLTDCQTPSFSSTETFKFDRPSGEWRSDYTAARTAAHALAADLRATPKAAHHYRCLAESQQGYPATETGHLFEYQIGGESRPPVSSNHEIICLTFFCVTT